MRSFRIGLVTAAIAALTIASASASDIARPAPSRSYIQKTPVYNWTGGYAGIQLGGMQGRGSSSVSVVGVGTFDLGSQTETGFIGGVHAGYDWQPVGSNFVYGVVAAGNYSSLDKNGVKQDWSGNIRGNVGYLLAERWQVYATGGLQISRFEFNSAPLAAWNEVRYGYVVGGGLKYAFENNWIAGVEATYTDLGRRGHNDTFAGFPLTVENRLSAFSVMASLSAKFN